MAGRRMQINQVIAIYCIEFASVICHIVIPAIIFFELFSFQLNSFQEDFRICIYCVSMTLLNHGYNSINFSSPSKLLFVTSKNNIYICIIIQSKNLNQQIMTIFSLATGMNVGSYQYAVVFCCSPLSVMIVSSALFK